MVSVVITPPGAGYTLVATSLSFWVVGYLETLKSCVNVRKDGSVPVFPHDTLVVSADSKTIEGVGKLIRKGLMGGWLEPDGMG